MGHKPCEHRRFETKWGITGDWCYAIGCCERGDMLCEYCADGKGDSRKPDTGEPKKRNARREKKRHG